MDSSDPKAANLTLPAPESGPGAAPQPIAGPFRVGAVVAGKYAIERVIGQGGLGFVVAARHLELEQLVAIKYLREEALGSATTVERFVREARLAAKIKSDHVVRIHDVGRMPDGAPYLVMEYLDGKDLRAKLDDGPLPVAEAVDYILQAAEALAEAHTAGIVHRDLKPDNLFLARRAAGSAIIKLLDFGISKLREQGLDVRTGATDRFGTPTYMSPEQLLSASDVDARADIWALGIILFELLTDRAPFDAESMAQLCTKILHEEPRPMGPLRPDVPKSLEEVIRKCIMKKREDRFANVAELAEELAPFAMPRSLDRVDHIVRVVREAGGVVRPPRPSMDDIAAADLGAVSSEPSTGARHTSAPSGRATPLSLASVPLDAPNGRWLAAAAAVTALLAAGGFFAVRAREAAHDAIVAPSPRSSPSVEGPSSAAAASAAPAAASSTSGPSASATAPPPAASVAAPSPPKRAAVPPPRQAPPPPSKNADFGDQL